MIEEQAIVVRIDGELAHLEIERSQPCGLCGATRGCGVSLWGRMFSGRRKGIAAPNALQLKVGDRVILALEEGGLLAGSLVAYLLPIVLICAGGLAGAWLGGSRAQSDLFAVIGALAGLLAGLALLKNYAAGAVQHQPTMLRRADTTVVRQCSR